MVEYRQWHEGEGDNVTFFSEGQVYFCQCDLNHRLSIFELLRLVTDAAVEDFNQRHMSYQILVEHGIGILVSRQSFRFHKMPVSNQKITVKTWEEKSEALQFVRAYEIFDTETKEPLVSGLSTWLLVDLNKRRIMPIKNFTLRPSPDRQTEHDCLPAAKFAPVENLRVLSERPVFFSDIDGNGHVNNSRYGSFVLDALPEEFQKLKFTDFRINYSQEAVLGQNIVLSGAFDEQAKKITVIGTQNDKVCFESELYY